MPTSPVISVRVSPEERRLLEDASAALGVKLSDFMRRRALDAAEIEVMERRRVEIPADAWEEVEAYLRRPAEARPALVELANAKPSWEA